MIKMMIIKEKLYLDVWLSTKIVYFCWFGVIDDLDQTVAINQVTIVEDHLALSVRLGVIIEMRYPASVEWRRPPDDSMNSVAFIKEKLSQVWSILTWIINNYSWIFFYIKKDLWSPVIPVIRATFLFGSAPLTSVLQWRWFSSMITMIYLWI